MIKKENFKNVLEKLGFENKSYIYTKNFNEFKTIADVAKGKNFTIWSNASIVNAIISMFDLSLGKVFNSVIKEV